MKNWNGAIAAFVLRFRVTPFFQGRKLISLGKMKIHWENEVPKLVLREYVSQFIPWNKTFTGERLIFCD